MARPLSFDLIERYVGGNDFTEEIRDNHHEREQMLRTLVSVMKGELTQRQQDCVRLYYFEGMKMHQIAAEFGVQTPAISRNLKRARTRMQTVLQYHFDRLAE